MLGGDKPKCSSIVSLRCSDKLAQPIRFGFPKNWIRSLGFLWIRILGSRILWYTGRGIRLEKSCKMRTWSRVSGFGSWSRKDKIFECFACLEYYKYKFSIINWQATVFLQVLWIHHLICFKYKSDKSLARPGRKKATATEDFDFHIAYL